MVKKVAIIGAGPCGVLLAHYLLRRGDRYQVDIYDRLSDPRNIEFSNARTYPITLTLRGINALNQIAGIEAAVRAIGLEIHGGIYHQNGKTRVTSRKKPMLTLDRTNLVITLLQQLTEKYDRSRLNLHFHHSCIEVNFAAKTITFQSPASISQPTQTHLTANYDLLVGADGARSQVRKAFLNTEMFEFEQKYVPTAYKSIVFSDPNQEAKQRLQADKIHSWRSKDGKVVLLLHQPDGSISGTILFPHQDEQVVQLTTPEAVEQFFHQHFPEVGQLMSAAAAEEFLQRPLSRVLTTRCNRYHYGDRVLILGDAAHSISPTLGQGCNAALEDVPIFDGLLDEYADNWAEAIAQFTVRRQADAIALSELSDYSYPSSARLAIEFVLRERIAKTLHQLFPTRFAPSLVDLVFETTIPYAEILHIYKGWIAKVKKSSQKILAAL